MFFEKDIWQVDFEQKKPYKWFKLLTEGREDINNDARTGRSSATTIDETVAVGKELLCRIVESLLEKFAMMSAYRPAQQCASLHITSCS